MPDDHCSLRRDCWYRFQHAVPQIWSAKKMCHRCVVALNGHTLVFGGDDSFKPTEKCVLYIWHFDAVRQEMTAQAAGRKQAYVTAPDALKHLCSIRSGLLHQQNTSRHMIIVPLVRGPNQKLVAMLHRGINTAAILYMLHHAKQNDM